MIHAQLRRFVLTSVTLLALLALASAGCGAEGTPAPRPAPRPAQCQSLSQLAPALLDLVRSGRAVNLRTVLERNKLLDPQADGTASPFITVMRVVLNTMNVMAHDPPERGAPAGELCNLTSAPAPRDANRICEVRRLITTFVHEGRGLDTLRLLDPLLASALHYIIGKPPSSIVPHYEIAATISDLCSKPALCRPEDTFDMLAGILSFIQPTAAEPKRPKNLLAVVNGLLQNPQIKGTLDSVNAKLTLPDLILFANLLIDNMLAMPTEPSAFAANYIKNLEIKVNDLLTNTLKLARTDPKYRDLRLAIDKILGPHEKGEETKPYVGAKPLLYDMLDPSRPQPILPAMQRSLSCLKKVDVNSVFFQMVYALGYKEGVVGLADVMKAVEGLADSDDRGTIVNFAITLVNIIRRDDEGLTATRKLCSVMFSNARPSPGEKSNAELVTPVITELFEQGAVNELVCVTDTLLFGCAGGPQPACPEGNIAK